MILQLNLNLNNSLFLYFKHFEFTNIKCLIILFVICTEDMPFSPAFIIYMIYKNLKLKTRFNLKQSCVGIRKKDSQYWFSIDY